MPYSEANDLYNVYGQNNIHTWADLENNEDINHITSRINWAIAKADREIDGKLSGGRYEVPFTTTPDDITEISACYAGQFLYESRRVKGSSKEKQNDLKPYKRAKAMLMDIKNDTHDLIGVDTIADLTDAPFVVKNDD